MTKNKLPIRSEYQEQCAIFDFVQIMITTGQYPELRLLNGSLNGVKLSIGQAVKAKKKRHEARLSGYISTRCPGWSPWLIHRVEADQRRQT